MYTLNCNGNLVDLSTPRVMGIINVTPDSFYDGGNTTILRDIIAQAHTMVEAGATFLDIGGYSSRPGAIDISEEEELKRTIPAIEAIKKELPSSIISIDTFRSSVAKQAVLNGADLINDISAGQIDENMMTTVAGLKVPYVMMHMKGTPQTMKNHAHYDHLVTEVISYFSERLFEARSAGISDLIMDPGFGFAKTLDHNFELLANLNLLQHLDAPILCGVSRKSMVYKSLGITPQDALNGTTALHSFALSKGTHILRVHDVAPAIESITLWEKLKVHL